MRTKELVVLSFLGAILYAVQVALSFLPNIEAVSALIIVYTVVYGRKALMSVYLFVLLEVIQWGLGSWNLFYLYVWLVLWVVAMIFRKNDTAFLWAVVAGFFGLGFGFLCSLGQAALFGIPAGLAYFVNGLPFDVLHCAGNFAATLILFRPVKSLLARLKNGTGA